MDDIEDLRSEIENVQAGITTLDGKLDKIMVEQGAFLSAIERLRKEVSELRKALKKG